MKDDFVNICLLFIYFDFFKINVSLIIVLINCELIIKYFIYLFYYMEICILIDSIERMYKLINYSCVDILIFGYFYLEIIVLCMGLNDI